MARSRNIKPGFFKNEDLAQVPFAARLLFAGLWCLADREGRLEDRPLRIKGELFPYEQVDVDDLLWQLASRNMIVRYSAQNVYYIWICRFSMHQNPHPSEKGSIIPPACEGIVRTHDKYVCSRETLLCNNADSLLLIPSSLIPDSLISDSKAKREKRAFALSVHMTNEQYANLIERFGESDTKDRIERLSLYKQSKGRQYKCDYSTILNWARKEEKPGSREAAEGAKKYE